MAKPRVDKVVKGNLVFHDHGIEDMPTTDLDATYLNESANLSDVDDVATARTNLGLVAGGAGDIWVEKAGDTMTGGLTVTPTVDTTTALKVTDKDANVEFNVDTVTGTVTMQGATVTGNSTTYTRVWSQELHPQTMSSSSSSNGMVQDTNYYYVSSILGRPKITRILKSDPTIQTVLELPPSVALTTVGRLVIDPQQQWLYVASSSTPAASLAVRVNLYDFATVEVRTKGITNGVFNYVISPDSAYVYILVGTTASYVLRVATASFVTDSGSQFASATSGAGFHGMTIDSTGTFLYVRDRVAGVSGISKVTTATMATAGFVSTTQSDQELAIEPSNTYLIAKGSTAGYFTRILLSDFSTKATKTISRSGYTMSVSTSFAVDSTYVYVAMSHASSPFCIARLTISDFSTVGYYDPSAGTAPITGAKILIDSTLTTLSVLAGTANTVPCIYNLDASTFTGGSVFAYFNHTGMGYVSTITNVCQLASPDAAAVYSTSLSLSSGVLHRYRISDADCRAISLLVASQRSDNQINARQFTIDNSSTYLYTTIRNSRTTETQIVKVDLTDFATVTWSSIGNKSSAVGGVAIDSTSTYLYVSYVANPVVVEKYTIATMTLASTLTLTGVNGTTNANILIDPTSTYLYVLPNGSATQINRITLSDFTTITTRTFGELGGTGFAGGVIDAAGTYLYVGLSGTRKIDLNDFASGAYTSSSSVGTPTSIDNTNGVVFCPNSTTGLGVVTVSDMSSYNIAVVTGSPYPAFNRYVATTSIMSGKAILCLVATAATGSLSFRNRYVLFARRPVNYETSTNVPMVLLNNGTKSVLAATESVNNNVFGDEMAYTTVAGLQTFISSQGTVIDGTLTVNGAIASFVGVGADTIAGKQMTGKNIIQTLGDGKVIFDADGGGDTYQSYTSATPALDTYLDGAQKESIGSSTTTLYNNLSIPGLNAVSLEDEAVFTDDDMVFL